MGRSEQTTSRRTQGLRMKISLYAALILVMTLTNAGLGAQGPKPKGGPAGAMATKAGHAWQGQASKKGGLLGTPGTIGGPGYRSNKKSSSINGTGIKSWRP